MSLRPFCLVEVCLRLLHVCKTAEPSQCLQGQPPASSPTGMLRGQLATYRPQGSPPLPQAQEEQEGQRRRLSWWQLGESWLSG